MVPGNSVAGGTTVGTIGVPVLSVRRVGEKWASASCKRLESSGVSIVCELLVVPKRAQQSL